MLFLEIDGTDITPYISGKGGFKWQRSDVDGPNAGRGLNGDAVRDRLGTKIRLDITCRPLTDAEASMVLTLIMPVWVTVRYYDVQIGAIVTRTMYSNNNPASFAVHGRDGRDWWEGITFPLIQQ